MEKCAGERPEEKYCAESGNWDKIETFFNFQAEDQLQLEH